MLALRKTKMFRSKKDNALAIGDIKDWRDAGFEIEALGNRLDHARNAAASATTSWARDFWITTHDRLFNKWRLMIQLKDTGLKQKGVKGNTSIDYHWYEKSEEIQMAGIAVLDNLFHNAGLDARLNESWANSKELSFQKARKGMA